MKTTLSQITPKILPSRILYWILSCGVHLALLWSWPQTFLTSNRPRIDTIDVDIGNFVGNKIGPSKSSSDKPFKASIPQRSPSQNSLRNAVSSKPLQLLPELRTWNTSTDADDIPSVTKNSLELQENIRPSRALVSTLPHPTGAIKNAQISVLNIPNEEFYSFLMRLSSSTTFYWGQNLQSIAEVIYYHIAKKFPNRDLWVTQVMLYLEEDGTVKKVDLLKSSGVESLDLAATSALTKSSPIRNPPLGLKRENGLILLPIEFSLNWNPSFIAQKSEK